MREVALECSRKRERSKDTGQGAEYSVQRRKEMESAAREELTDLEIRVK